MTLGIFNEACLYLGHCTIYIFWLRILCWKIKRIVLGQERGIFQQSGRGFWHLHFFHSSLWRSLDSGACNVGCDALDESLKSKGQNKGWRWYYRDKNLAILVHLCFKEQYKNKTNIVTSQERHLRPIKAVELWPLYSSTKLDILQFLNKFRKSFGAK